MKSTEPGSNAVEWNVLGYIIPETSLENVETVRLKAGDPYTIRIKFLDTETSITYRYLPAKDRNKDVVDDIVEFSLPSNFPVKDSGDKTFQAHRVGKPYLMHFFEVKATKDKYVFGRFSQFTENTVMLDYFKGKPLDLK